MNIVFIRYKYTPFGGAERYLERLSETLMARGYHTEIRHARLPSWLPSWLKVLLFNIQVCRRKKEEIYFSLDRITCPDIYRAGDGVHKAYLRIKGFTLNPLHLSYLWLERRTFSNAKCIIANSNMVKKEIIQHYNIPSDKIKVIYNGIFLPVYDKIDAKNRLCDEFGVDKKEKIILFVGSGFARKGVEEFLEIISLLDGSFRAFVVGKEKRIRFYRAKAKELGVEEKVFFAGPRKDADMFYAASDIFLFPTRYEPFSNAVLEAMSYENVVFTTERNGAAEILERDFVISGDDFAAAASKIDKLLNDPEMLAAARKRSADIASGFSMERNVEETLKVIHECAD